MNVTQTRVISTGPARSECVRNDKVSARKRVIIAKKLRKNKIDIVSIRSVRYVTYAFRRISEHLERASFTFSNPDYRRTYCRPQFCVIEMCRCRMISLSIFVFFYRPVCALWKVKGVPIGQPARAWFGFHIRCCRNARARSYDAFNKRRTTGTITTIAISSIANHLRMVRCWIIGGDGHSSVRFRQRLSRLKIFSRGFKILKR